MQPDLEMWRELRRGVNAISNSTARGIATYISLEVGQNGHGDAAEVFSRLKAKAAQQHAASLVKPPIELHLVLCRPIREQVRSRRCISFDEERQRTSFDQWSHTHSRVTQIPLQFGQHGTSRSRFGERLLVGRPLVMTSASQRQIKIDSLNWRGWSRWTLVWVVTFCYHPYQTPIRSVRLIIQTSCNKFSSCSQASHSVRLFPISGLKGGASFQE